MKNSNNSGFIIPTKLKLKFGLVSKGWIYDAQCDKVLEVARKCILKEKMTNCVTANANIAQNSLP